MFNVSLPGKKQILNVLGAMIYSFLSTFIGVVVLAGGIQNNMEATIAIALSGAVAGINAALYTLKITLFDEKK
jgi:hypothetical protein